MARLIFNKRNLRLNEDNNGSNGNAYVEPSSNNTNSLASDLNKAKQENPTDDTFIFNANSYDGKETNNTITLDISAENPTDAANKFQELRRNPYTKNMMTNTNVNVRAKLQSESLQRKKENCVSFSKKEINEMLKK